MKLKNSLEVGMAKQRIIEDDMPEDWYRACRLCSALANPKTYALLRILVHKGKLTPADLARQLNRSPVTISVHLRQLRNLDLVRFQKAGRQRFYWIKDAQVSRIFRELERFVSNVRRLK